MLDLGDVPDIVAQAIETGQLDVSSRLLLLAMSINLPAAEPEVDIEYDLGDYRIGDHTDWESTSCTINDKSFDFPIKCSDNTHQIGLIITLLVLLSA
jgi:hypothetical protein